ncbi:hypothetical protein ACFC14_18755 [Microbacterium sp. NPDC055988]|uniref:hypothetical protein n=1 Tax=Microbacterium sp. NPDC055988 TaxID=3345671 RepID=UPI0035E0BEE2
MTQHDPHNHEQWALSTTPEAQTEMEKLFRSGRVEMTPRTDPELVRMLSGTDPAGESYLEKVGRINNARTRATEIAMADLPRPVDQDDWEHRFEIWQGGHPFRVLLREFHRAMDEIEDRTPETPEDETAQTADATSTKTWLLSDLERAGLPTHLAEQCLQPTPVEGTDVATWQTPASADAAITTLLRGQWESLAIATREAAWDAPSDGADYYQATQRVAQGLPRF